MWNSKDEKDKDDPTQLFVPEDSPADIKKKEAIQGYYQDSWRKKQQEADKGLADAQSQQNIGSLVDVAGGLLTNFQNSKKSPTYLPNRLQDLGRANDSIQPTEAKWNSVKPLFDQKVSDARVAKEDSYKGLERDMRLQQADSEFQDKGMARNDQQKARDKADRMQDPNSEESVQMRDWVKSNYPGLNSPNFDKASASFLESKLPMLAQKFQADENRKMRAEDREATRENTNELRLLAAGQKATEKAEKTTEKMEQLRVGDLGYAQTPDDAKQLKEATITKADFDKKLDEMIALREKHGGGTITNRTDVARGQQLSKDLLLAYKNMQKLGVLSQSDEAIVNAIIPSDPLQYNSIAASVQGQDPLLSNMKAFRADTQDNYHKNLDTRLRREGRNPSVNQPAGNTPKSGVMHGSNLPD